MPIPVILSAVDTRITSLLPTWQAKQEEFRATHGRYWQGLWNHSAVPADGAEITPDRVTDKPYYQTENWDAMGLATVGKQRTRVKVDQYVAPGGPGWTATFQIQVSGVVWERTISGAGPETFRESSWSIAVDQ